MNPQAASQFLNQGQGSTVNALPPTPVPAPAAEEPKKALPDWMQDDLRKKTAEVKAAAKHEEAAAAMKAAAEESVREKAEVWMHRACCF
jgi:hypothetical protein